MLLHILFQGGLWFRFHVWFHVWKMFKIMAALSPWRGWKFNLPFCLEPARNDLWFGEPNYAPVARTSIFTTQPWSQQHKWFMFYLWHASVCDTNVWLCVVFIWPSAFLCPCLCVDSLCWIRRNRRHIASSYACLPHSAPLHMHSVHSNIYFSVCSDIILLNLILADILLVKQLVVICC